MNYLEKSYRYKTINQLNIVLEHYNELVNDKECIEDIKDNEKMIRIIEKEILRKQKYIENKENERKNKYKEKVLYDNLEKKGINMKQYKTDLQVGKIGETETLIKLKKLLNIDNIYKRDELTDIIDFYIGDKEDKILTEIELEVKTRSDYYYWGKYNTWIFGENKLKHLRKKLKEKKCKRAFILFNLYIKHKLINGKIKGYGERELYYWEVKLDNDNEIYKISKDIYNKKRNDISHNNVEVWSKYLKPLKELDLKT